MEQTHRTIRRLIGRRPDSDAFVIPSVVTASKAVIFVHGYGGDPAKTWAEFHGLAPTSPDFVNVDLYFYGYDGLRSELTASAGLFRGFLRRLGTAPGTLINQTLPQLLRRPSDFEYTKIVIAGHSLGAVLARRALVDLTKSGESWVSRVSLALFAPAHMGATISELAKIVSSANAIFAIFTASAKFKSPLISQLSPNSAELALLRAEVSELTRRGNAHLLAEKVVIAQFENVVSNVGFPGDPDAYPVEGHDHKTVCKPTRSYSVPLDIVRACL